MTSIPLFVEGKDFKVKNDVKIPYCYGVGNVHETFMELQKQINRFATRAGFTPLKLDGFIGDKTVKSAQQVAKTIQTEQSPESLRTIANSPTKEWLASNAGKLVHELRATADAFESARPTA